MFTLVIFSSSGDFLEALNYIAIFFLFFIFYLSERFLGHGGTSLFFFSLVYES